MIFKNADEKNQSTRCRDQSWAQGSPEPVALDRIVTVLPKPPSDSVATNGVTTAVKGILVPLLFALLL